MKEELLQVLYEALAYAKFESVGHVDLTLSFRQLEQLVEIVEGEDGE